MTQLSLGLIETAGLTAAVTAADAAMKSANVELVGYELAKGNGMATVKVLGDVGAIKAAVAAGAAAGAAVGRVVSTSVIARPAGGIGCMIASKETVGAKTKNSCAPATEKELPTAATSSGTGFSATETERAIAPAEQGGESDRESELPPAGRASEVDASSDMVTEAAIPAEPGAESGTESQTKATVTVSLQTTSAKQPAGKAGKKSRK